MRPYFIDGGQYCMKLWIDLDHILAIHDPWLLPLDQEYLWSQGELSPSFSIIMMFKDKPITYQSVPPKRDPSAWPQVLVDIKQAHADLVGAWMNGL
jgi:hypothetical protein